MNLHNKHIFEGLFGLERETLRVTQSGKLSSLPHPFSDNPNLSRDFCENQLELITRACPDLGTLFCEMQKLDTIVRDKLDSLSETLWLNSNPPRIKSEDDIIVANFNGDEALKKEYRLKLQERYGKRLMLYSGIHFNFSFSEEFIKSLYDGNEDYQSFKNSLYFKLSKQVFRYGWLITLLTASSPVYDLSLDGDNQSGSGFDGYASKRSGDKGYWNKFLPILDYTDLNAYVASIKHYINSGKLFSAGELYLPVRLKPENGSEQDLLLEYGVNHIELRMFDLNPLAKLGIFRSDLEFTHYFLIYLLQLPDFDFTPQLQETAVRNHQSAARYDLSEIKINGYRAEDAAVGLLNDMSEYFKDFPNILNSIHKQKEKVTLNKRYCIEIYDKLISDFQKNMLNISQRRD